MSQLEDELEARAREVCDLMESGKGRDDIARYLQGLELSVGDRGLVEMRGSQLFRERGGSVESPSDLSPSQAAFYDQVLDHLEDDEFIASLQAGLDDENDDE